MSIFYGKVRNVYLATDNLFAASNTTYYLSSIEHLELRGGDELSM